jgi:hypothetical protein
LVELEGFGATFEIGDEVGVFEVGELAGEAVDEAAPGDLRFMSAETGAAADSFGGGV